MLKHILIGCVVAFSSLVSLAAGDVEPEVAGWGTLRAIRIDGQRFPVITGMDVASPQWKKMEGLSAWVVKDVKYSLEAGDRATYTGTIPFGDSPVSYKQVITTEQAGVRVRVEATPQKAVPSEGIRFFVSVPVADFAGGDVELLGGQPGKASAAALPVEKLEKPHFLSGGASGVRLAKGERSLTVRFDKPRHAIVQDNRVYNAQEYSVYFMLHTGDLVAGQTLAAELLISAEAAIDRSAVTLEVKPQEELHDLHGFGGNFVYSSESPSSLYNLDHLNVAWGRAWMPLHLWEPVNDNADVTTTDMKVLAANDKPNTQLRYSLEMARELQKRGIPYIVSIWPVPAWMASNPGKPGENKHGIIIAREMWDELAESIGSYLLYAREQYGCEPAMFSFNEPDYGVMVKLTPEEHRDLVILLGRHFEKLGLKTRLLAADVAHARGSAKYALPVLQSPDAAKYVDAIGFHTWGGATPEQYREWGDVATRSGKPLLVTEAGVEAQAWRHSAVFNAYWYAHEEAKQYMEILQYARPQGILLWEYTDDYGILKIDRSANPPKVTPTKRFHFMRQFAVPTPRNGKAVQAGSSRPDILIAAVKSPEGKLTMHILNDGPSRKANLARADGSYTAYVTDRQRDMQQMSDVSSGEVELPAWSLVTLVAK